MAASLEPILEALKARLSAGLPTALIDRDMDKPERFSRHGTISIRAGQLSEESAVLLSGGGFSAVRNAELDLAAPTPTGSATDQQAFDDFLRVVVAIIDGDRFLGGLCGWVQADICRRDELSVEGAEARQTGVLVVRLEYETASAALA